MLLQNPPEQVKLEARLAQRVAAQPDLRKGIQQHIAQQFVPNLQALQSGQEQQKEAPAEQQPGNEDPSMEDGELGYQELLRHKICWRHGRTLSSMVVVAAQTLLPLQQALLLQKGLSTQQAWQQLRSLQDDSQQTARLM